MHKETKAILGCFGLTLVFGFSVFALGIAIIIAAGAKWALS
jgi:hypothetical protein